MSVLRTKEQININLEIGNLITNCPYGYIVLDSLNYEKGPGHTLVIGHALVHGHAQLPWGNALMHLGMAIPSCLASPLVCPAPFSS